MIDITTYDGEGADLAFVADLASRLTEAQDDVITSGDGFAILADGRKVSWTEFLDRPPRRRGTVPLADPEGFAAYVLRNATSDTVLYADRDNGSVTAVFDDNPRSGDDPLAADEVAAGYRQDRAVLRLLTGEDWRDWAAGNRVPMSQTNFGDHVDTLAHTMVEPSAAEMLEIATTLTGKQKIDIDSRTNLGTGAMSFSFTEDTQLRAGRGNAQIEIPQTISFRCAPWRGTGVIEFEARLRVKADASGVKMLYVILRMAETLDNAFGIVLDDLRELLGDGIPIYRGEPA